MKKIIVILAVVLLSTGLGFSQSIWHFNYNMGYPTGDLNEFVSNAGFRGFNVSGNWFVSDNVTLGGSIQWNGFEEKNDRATYQLEDGAITATNWNRVYSAPFMLNSQYHFSPDNSVSPFVGIGVGTYYLQQEIQAGKYVSQDKNWKIGFAPEVGAFIPMGTGHWGMNAKVAYNMVFYNVQNITNLSYISVSVGFSLYNY